MAGFDISAIVSLLFALLPVIFILMLFKQFRRMKFMLPFLLVLGLFASVALIPTVAAVSANPGTTTTMMGFPVTQTFSGLSTGAVTYDVYDATNAAVVTGADAQSADSAGKLTITITQSDTGRIKYQLRNETNSDAVLLTFYIDNMDIIVYLVPIIGIMVLLIVVRSITRAVQF